MAEASTDTDKRGFSADEKIMLRAREELKRANDWEGDAVKNFVEDMKFAEADPRNGDQWPAKLYASRSGEGGQDRPSLTINKTRVHCNLVINQALKNKSSIRISPTGGGSSYQAAQIMQACVRRIEYISKATMAYKKAINDQVKGGMGYVVLETAYVNDRSDDQDIYIRRVKDATCIRLDPDINEPDGSDADFGFIFERMPRAKFERHPKYHKFKDKIGASALGQDDLWFNKDYVLIAKYYVRTGISDTLITYIDPEKNEKVNVRASELVGDDTKKELLKQLIADIDNGVIDGSTRPVTDQKVKWYFIAGDCIIDRGDWAGRYVPIIRCPGEEVVLNGKLDRKGLTRYLIDSQRMLNYNASGSVEFGALQNKAPYMASSRSIEGQEQWKNGNVDNYQVMLFNDIDEEAPEGLQKIEAPKRQEPPKASTLYAMGTQEAERFMMAESGQYQSQFGENENAKSGVAINERQEQGDIATFNLNSNQADMFTGIGVQVVDLIPKIYDTKRIIRITHDNGKESDVTIDPRQQVPLMEMQDEKDEQAAQVIFNPGVGEYEVVADAGPNFSTQRKEAWNAISTILQQNMELAAVIGDLLFQYGDFPGATDIMERLQREIKATKPYLFEDGPTPEMAQLQAQMQKLGKLNTDLVQKLAEMQLSAKNTEEKNKIDVFRANTDRLDVLENQPGGEKAFQALIQKAVADALREHLMPPQEPTTAPEA